MKRMQAGSSWTHGSGLTWLSGAYTMFNENTQGPAAVDLFGAFRGRPCDVAVGYISDANWGAIAGPATLFNSWQGWPGTMSFATPLLPSDGVSTLAAGASGSYDSHWTAFATTIAGYPAYANAIIRLGWEFNGNWYPWNCLNSTDAGHFATYWQKAVTAIRTVAPGLKFDWCVNRGSSPGLADPTQAWPGSAYVDYVGVDSYDRFNPYSVDHTMFTGTQGLNSWLSYAQTKGVLFSVPEWACWSLVSGNANAGGGDDPAYITAMINFFRANAASIGYESMFQGVMPVPPIGTLPSAAAAYISGLQG